MDLRDALIDWDEPNDEGSNTAHIAEHGLTQEEFESALFDESTTFDVLNPAVSAEDDVLPDVNPHPADSTPG